jgi:predicted small lipoprotein YifL
MYEQGSTGLMTSSRLQLGLVLGLLALSAFSLSGCGVRGSLEAPEGVTKTGEAKPGSTPDPSKPHQPSILDPLIR